MCALGAVHAVQNALHGSAYDPLTRTITDNDLAEPAHTKLARHIARKEGRADGMHPHVPGWNDAPDRMAEDVILALNEAAAE